jgi:hypothetical protein
VTRGTGITFKRTKIRGMVMLGTGLCAFTLLHVLISLIGIDDLVA